MTNIAIGTRRNENLRYKTCSQSKLQGFVITTSKNKKHSVTTFHTNEYFVYFFYYEY